jgi:hypothetical protein
MISQESFAVPEALFRASWASLKILAYQYLTIVLTTVKHGLPQPGEQYEHNLLIKNDY